MARLRVHNFTISLDGFAAGPRQSLGNPLGDGGLQLHEWIFQTRSMHELQGRDGGETGVNDDLFRARTAGVGATIMGRNMFGPVRGSWDSVSEEWLGWWGEDPPFHHQVYVLTHHPRPSVEMKGGTVFHFVTDGIEAAHHRAFDAADGQDVRLGGGAATIRQYLRADLVDEMHLTIAPVLLGGGERLFDEPRTGVPGLEVVDFTPSRAVAHVRLARTARES
jgi:dihydrofolate reductase